MIPTDLLLAFGAQEKNFVKGTVLFNEGQSARFYYQVEKGEVKTRNLNADGKEFIQGIFTSGDSFGESTLFNGKKYPVEAITLSDAIIYVQPKSAFLNMLHNRPETAISLCTRLANRLYYKTMIAAEIASHDPEHRLLKLIDFLKTDVGNCQPSELYQVALTRQQLADLTGLRVETVIRTIKALEKKGILSVNKRKIYR